MWKTKTFKFSDMETAAIARAKLDAWLRHNRGRIQYEELFINNAYGVTYRKLRRIY